MVHSLYSILTYVLPGFVFLAMLSIVYTSWRNGITPMPATAQVRQAVACEINRLAPQGKLVEAGSGWGTLALQLGKACPGWHITGIENSPIPLWISRFFLSCLSAIKRGTYAGVTFKYGNLYTYSYSDVDVMVCYLYPGAMKRISEIADRQFPREMNIISVCFALPGRLPERIVTCTDLYRTKVYVY